MSYDLDQLEQTLERVVNSTMAGFSAQNITEALPEGFSLDGIDAERTANALNKPESEYAKHVKAICYYAMWVSIVYDVEKGRPLNEEYIGAVAHLQLQYESARLLRHQLQKQFVDGVLGEKDSITLGVGAVFTRQNLEAFSFISDGYEERLSDGYIYLTNPNKSFLKFISGFEEVKDRYGLIFQRIGKLHQIEDALSATLNDVQRRRARDVEDIFRELSKYYETFVMKPSAS